VVEGSHDRSIIPTITTVPTAQIIAVNSMESVIGVISLVKDSLMVKQVQAETVNISQTEIRMRVVVTGHTIVIYCMTLKSPLKSIGTSRPVQFLQPDHMGPFTTSKAINKYICLAVDAHIKFLWYAATCSVDEISTTLFLFNEVVCQAGTVENVMSDQGAFF